MKPAETSKEYRVETLRNCIFLNGLSNDVLEDLATKANTLHVDEGATIITAGETGSTMFFMSNRPGGFANYDLWQVSINSKPESLQKEDDIDTFQNSPESDDRKEVMPDNSQ